MKVANSRTTVWAGRILSGLVISFLLFDGIVKLIRVAPVVEATIQLGYPGGLTRPIGIALLLCVIAYAIPRTSVLGAILLTAYLGGAVATQVRVENPWFAFPIGFGVLVWAGLFLRDRRLSDLVPLRG